MRTAALMKYLLVASIFAVFIAGCVTIDDANIVSELTRMERELVEATLRGDTTSVGKLLADDFIGIDPNGKRFSKTEVLANLIPTDASILDLRHEDIRISVFDGCAVATASTIMKWSHGREKMEGQFPYMRFWIKRHGNWLTVAT